MRIGSLFSGYGGLDMAVTSVLRADVAWHVEYEDAPSRILSHHYPDIPNHGDITAVDWSAVEPVDILCGGYPCQPFSSAGARRGANDDRHLWPYFRDAISHLGPRLVVLENVRNHLTLGFADVLGDLASMGFSARWGIVRAADAGAPHNRARLFVVAHPDSAARDERWQSAPRKAESWRARPDVGRRGGAPTTHAQSHQQREQQAKRGQVRAEPWHGSWGDYGPAIRRWESILGRVAPPPTQPGRAGTPRLSPAFVEWLMGIPEGWVTDPQIGISKSDQMKALGNGVVPQQAAMALRLLLAA